MSTFLPPPMMDTRHIKRKWLDVPYANQSFAQQLDIYLPDIGDGPFPVIAGFHGGAWMFGDKGDVLNLALLRGLKYGYAVVCANYRMSGEAIFPAQIYDCKAAIRYLKANASKYLLDSRRIAVWGASAGGHLVALLGTSAGVKELEDLSMGNANESSAVQVVVDWCGPAENFLLMDEEYKESGSGTPDHSGANSPESKLLGRRITEVPELVKFASPLTYIGLEMPYFLIQHGTKDSIVPVQQSIHFAAALEKAAGKDRVTLDLLEGVEHHGDPRFETEENLKRVFDFLDAHLKTASEERMQTAMKENFTANMADGPRLFAFWESKHYFGAYHLLRFGEEERGKILTITVDSKNMPVCWIELWPGSFDGKDSTGWASHRGRDPLVSTGHESQLNPALTWKIEPGEYTVYFVNSSSSKRVDDLTISFQIEVR
jgi:acetyl esterase/lipase